MFFQVSRPTLSTTSRSTTFETSTWTGTSTKRVNIRIGTSTRRKISSTKRPSKRITTSTRVPIFQKERTTKSSKHGFKTQPTRKFDRQVRTTSTKRPKLRTKAPAKLRSTTTKKELR